MAAAAAHDGTAPEPTAAMSHAVLPAHAELIHARTTTNADCAVPTGSLCGWGALVSHDERRRRSGAGAVERADDVVDDAGQVVHRLGEGFAG